MKKSGKSAKGGYLVFISHSSKDRWVAKQMARLIEGKGRKYGVTTFLDEKDIQTGDPFRREIRKNLQQCDEFLVLLSRNSIKSSWVVAEIGGAWTLEKRMVAIIDKLIPREIPEVINPYKAVDLNSFEEYLDQLLQRVKEAGIAYGAKRKR
jgi:hypothetical protein